MTRTQIRLALFKYAVEHPDQRLGQALFNGLAKVDLDAADKIYGTTSDPFYNNDRVPAFLAALDDMFPDE